MQIKEKVRKTVSELSAVICDKCKTRVEVDDVFEMQEMLSLTIQGGYASVLGDGSTYDMDLCQKCVKEVLGPYLVEREDGSKGHQAPASEA